MEEKEKKERTVIHLYIKENDTHHYFGSIANVFEYFSPDIYPVTYISYNTLYYNKLIVHRKNQIIIRHFIPYLYFLRAFQAKFLIKRW